MYFSYEHLNFRYEPFPIGLAKPVMDESVYQELVDNYPAIEQFHYIPKLGKKYSLSERFNPRGYHSLIRSQPVWREFHCWIKSDAFVAGVLDALKERDLDLGYELSASPARRTLKLLKDIARGRTTARLARLRARFEFSMLPADGGHILPHTDAMMAARVAERRVGARSGDDETVNGPRKMVPKVVPPRLVGKILMQRIGEAEIEQLDGRDGRGNGLLARDVQYVCEFVAPFGVERDAEKIASDLWRRYRTARL